MNTGGSAPAQQTGYMRSQTFGPSHIGDPFDPRLGLATTPSSGPSISSKNRSMPQGSISSLLPQQQAMMMRQQQAQRPPQQPPLTAPTDGGPPYKVPIHPIFTRIQPLEPGQPFPTINAQDQSRVKQWMERDLAYESELAIARRGKRAEQGQIQQDVLMRED
jgi:hypothetical protein